MAMGSLKYPFTEEKRHVFLGVDVDVKQGGCQIEYDVQDPRIHKALASRGTGEGQRRPDRGMGAYIDEPVSLSHGSMPRRANPPGARKPVRTTAAAPAKEVTRSNRNILIAIRLLLNVVQQKVNGPVTL